MLSAEYQALTQAAALLDFSARGRLCVLGADREKFLHGQVSNEVKSLRVGDGCYAALVSPKGRIESDLFIYKLEQELLLDFEPGLAERIASRLNRYIIAGDVQIVDVSAVYCHLTVQGPASAEILRNFSENGALPEKPFSWVKLSRASGELYLMRNNRLHSAGFDLFAPVEEKEDCWARLRASGAQETQFAAFDTVRLEQAIPRFGVDMDETNLVPETGIASRAISYSKGCYIGQEIIARIRTYGQVAKALRLLQIEGEGELPQKGDRLLKEGKDAGLITSSTWSPRYNSRIALGYVRKEINGIGEKLLLETSGQSATIIAAPDEA